MSLALTLAVSSLLLLLLMADERRAWRIGFALGWIVTGLKLLPCQLSHAVAHRLCLVRLALAVRWHTLLWHVERQLTRYLPGATWLRAPLVHAQRRYRLRLVVALSRYQNHVGHGV